MATHKLEDFMKALRSASNDCVMLSIGISLPLVRVLHDLLTARELKGDVDMLLTHDKERDGRLSAFESEATNLQAMRGYIAERLSKLNACRGHSDVVDDTIDEISRAIAIGSDPTVIMADQEPTGTYHVVDDASRSK